MTQRLMFELPVKRFRFEKLPGNLILNIVEGYYTYGSLDYYLREFLQKENIFATSKSLFALVLGRTYSKD